MKFPALVLLTGLSIIGTAVGAPMLWTMLVGAIVMFPAFWYGHAVGKEYQQRITRGGDGPFGRRGE